MFERKLWEAYKRVNEIFCEAILKVADPDDVVLVNDYHLTLLPFFIRQKIKNIKIGFFLHIPFPSFEIFRLLPWRREILKGLLEADLIGFHTYDYVKHFLESVRRILGHEHAYGEMILGNRIVKVDAFPMGIDYEKFSKAALDDKVQREIHRIRERVGDRKLILSVDRLDYTKGIPQRLEAFSLFLDRCCSIANEG